MRDFIKSHGYDTVLAVLGIVFGGAILRLFNEVLDAWGTYPVPLAVCCGLSIVVGLGLSAIADRKAVLVAKVHEDGETARAKLALEEREAEKSREEEEAREDARRKAAQRDAVNIASVRQMEFQDKEYLFSIYKQGSVDVPSAYRWEIEQMGFRDMVDYETVGDDDRWSLRPWAKDLLDRNPSLFDCVIEAMEPDDDTPFS